MYFDGLDQRTVQLIKMLLERGSDRGYLLKKTKSIFIEELPAQEAAARREFEAEGMELKFVWGRGGKTWGPLWGPGKSWSHGCDRKWSHGVYGVCDLGYISKRQPQSDYVGLGIFLQLGW